MSWSQQIFNWLGHARYLATLPTRADQQVGELLTDRNGRLLVTSTPTSITTTWTSVVPSTASGILQASPGRLHQLLASNTGAAAAYLMLFDAPSVPANGVTPWLVALPIAAGQAFTFGLEGRGRSFLTGLCWAASSTADALTLDTGAQLSVQAEME